MNSLTIQLNRQPVRLAGAQRLDDLIREHYGEPRGLAVALNNKVVPRSRWAATELSEDDRLDVFHAVAGG